MIIRHATPSDAGMLSELGARTFSEAFGRENTPANLAAHLRNSFSPEIQHRELSEADTIFLIAEADGQPIGYAQLVFNSREQSMEASNPMEIRRIYVLQESVGRGVGSELMSASLDEAGSMPVTSSGLESGRRISERLIFTGDGDFVGSARISSCLATIRKQI